MKALIYAVMSAIVAGMAIYSAYQEYQINKAIEKLSKDDDEGEAVKGCNIPKPSKRPKAPPRKDGKVEGTQQ